MEFAKLIWDKGKECWVCTNCQAEYHYPENSKPKPSYCMKCKVEWLEGD